MTLHDLPWINAILNGSSATLVAAGLIAVKAGKHGLHRNLMIAGLICSTLFLGSYLYYHAHVGATHFRNPDWFRPIYLTLLTTHTLLAVIIVPLIIATVLAAWSGNLKRHVSLARWTWPLWLYVSVTGVLIYLLLYRIYPQSQV